MKTTHRSELTGTGKLTVGQLEEIAARIGSVAPNDAQVLIEATQDPRDHDWSWRAVVVWETEL